MKKPMTKLLVCFVVSFVFFPLCTRVEANELGFIEPPGAYRYEIALPDKDSGFRIDLQFCKGCGICARECAFGAVHMVREERE